ncbi:MAG: glycerol-3-phosphate 1-O-acyltransferase PlsY [Candidatus Cloacimonetes bacterium]|jgi:glycerol-3-phosphate acyltransferase PlsY|nr:glycerol-3-phosphate 1-O-acyltransferase PlsY [Candidatus Cloacimonadota bacterium]MDY0337570.1 glycerol-3-phosphate 1-O-acyltransferase PlsY [Candidatus Cloacimonadaceae bacterium]MCK9334869.1 glycerol-3-phosphate 1-O-acyltransferase PlsY [Candidatus Cloacimonadota bacterium]MDD2544081.1 glycerol-3-phosphate 1-O-acyltransferase PlsY [Candidatus Cloacimonadota bacterium]MDD2684095.1 glycerol-3-phosphate 1-O-acyltransferase PlsY [Candidatus Cloacimonadota bacterium]
MNSIDILLPLLAYLLGSIPIGWIIARLVFKTDIRHHGSGNIGATNALRQFGTTIGILVMLLDMTKGILAVLFAKSAFGVGHPLVVLCGLLAILGHVFPVWLKFKGGKGVATAAGVFVALSPWNLLIGLLVFVVMVAITKYVSLGSIVAALSLLLFHLIDLIRGSSRDYALLALVFVVVAMIIYKHRTNISRLRNGTESKISFSKKGKA